MLDVREYYLLYYTGSQKYGALEKRLTHLPFTQAFTGSNPVRVTNKTQKAFRKGFFIVYEQDFQNIPEIPILNAKNHF